MPPGIGHADVYHLVREAIDRAHADGVLKERILAEPERFIELDPDLVLTLRDQRAAGRQLLLITNSEWEYAKEIMAFAFDRFLPEGTTWRDLFSCIIVSANKPAFFTGDSPLYKVVDEERALLRPHLGPIEPGSVFFGGSARLVERSLGLSGDQILYVGDHIFGDVHFSKALLRWRTALILRELESEIAALVEFLPRQRELERLMADKERLEAEFAALRLAAMRRREGYAAPPVAVDDVHAELDRVRAALEALDEEIAPLAVEASRLRNSRWGPMMRAGIDKSLFARQVERYADLYTSRVSNFLYPGPFAIFRTGRLDLPHDAKLRRRFAD
ncbi:MAG TPA: HAD family hydrolase [Actinobacteria bacterium]|nr:HAD family hydrolase [Actinomycetota bacterium]